MAGNPRHSPILLLALGLFAASLLLSPVSGSGTYLPRLLFIAGMAALVWGIVRAWPVLRRFAGRMRDVAEPGPTLTWLLTGLLLLVVSIGLFLRPVRADLTVRGIHSLSTPSREALSRLERDVELVAVYRETSAEWERAEDLLQVYRVESRRVQARLLDPERNPERARQLGITFRTGLLVRADSVSEVLGEISEPAVTRAILRVTRPDRPLIAVLDGHGELAVGRAGLVQLYDLLGEGGFARERLFLGGVLEVPDAVKAVLVVGPQSPLLPGELGALHRFVDRGGRVGVFLDPGQRSGMDEWLGIYGVRIDGRGIQDPGALTRSVGIGPEVIAVQGLGEHPTTRGLTSGIILRGATRVGLTAEAIWGVNATDLLRSAPTARLMDAPGEISERAAAWPVTPVLPLGAALDWVPRSHPGEPPTDGPGERRTSRLVVIGDSDFLRDDTIELYGNREFARRIIGWLGERDLYVQFPEADRSGTPLKVGLRGLQTVFYVVQIFLPLALMGVGVVVWFRRR